MRKENQGPSMFDEFVETEGIKLKVDPINRKRTEDEDNVMAIFEEEQPFTWRFSRPYIREALDQSEGSIDFLDVGTGSGIFGIWVAKHFDANVVAIDKSPRAIRRAKENAENNGVKLNFQHEKYSYDSAPRGSAKVIGLYPPYHLYPEEIAEKIPQHARGGSDGQEEFRNQLKIANHHLADKGIIFFNQMAVGNDNGPEFLDYIPKFVSGNPSITYTNVFPPMPTKEFLEGVYGSKHPEYVAKMSAEHPIVYYCVGIITRDGEGKVSSIDHGQDLKGRSWQDRILLHKEIAEHEYK